VLQALVRHDIVKGTRGPHGGYQLAREERRITADDILRAAGTAAEMDCTPVAHSPLLKSVVLPVLREAEDAFSAELARIDVEDLARSAAALQNSSEPHDESPHWPEESLAAQSGQQEHSNANSVFHQYRDAECVMDWNRIEGNWKQFKGQAKEKWGRLTDDDLDVINGRQDQLEGKIQERYGLAKDQAKKDVDTWFRSLP
jgi:uncharacterized protein YjbJ (UPF0337 family)